MHGNGIDNARHMEIKKRKQNSKGLAWRVASLINVETKNIATRCVWMFESPLKL